MQRHGRGVSQIETEGSALAVQPLTYAFSLRFADLARALPAERGIDFALRYLEPRALHAPCLARMLKLYGASQEGPNA